MSQDEIAVQERVGVRGGARKAAQFPTPAMERFAEVSFQLGVTADDELRCKEAKISPKTLKIWQRRREFREWLRGEVEQRLADDAWQMWLKVRKAADEGDQAARKAYLERFGTAPRRTDNDMPDTFHALAELAHLAAESCKEALS